jgi:hypothetical protein
MKATKAWPAEKEMSKYGYCVVEVSNSKQHVAGHKHYDVLDYKSAALVGKYEPSNIYSYLTLEAAAAAVADFEKIDMSMSRTWRAGLILMARSGLRKSKGPQPKPWQPR